MSQFLRSTALALALGFFLPAPSPVTGIVFDPAAYAAIDGSIPDWINAACCGPSDAHKLRLDAAHQRQDGFWEVDGYNGPPVNPSQVHATQDDHVWAFYRENADGSAASGIYCLFLPLDF